MLSDLIWSHEHGTFDFLKWKRRGSVLTVRKKSIGLLFLFMLAFSRISMPPNFDVVVLLVQSLYLFLQVPLFDSPWYLKYLYNKYIRIFALVCMRWCKNLIYAICFMIRYHWNAFSCSVWYTWCEQKKIELTFGVHLIELHIQLYACYVSYVGILSAKLRKSHCTGAYLLLFCKWNENRSASCWCAYGSYKDIFSSATFYYTKLWNVLNTHIRWVKSAHIRISFVTRMNITLHNLSMQLDSSNAIVIEKKTVVVCTNVNTFYIVPYVHIYVDMCCT